MEALRYKLTGAAESLRDVYSKRWTPMKPSNQSTARHLKSPTLIWLLQIHSTDADLLPSIQIDVVLSSVRHGFRYPSVATSPCRTTIR